MSIFGSIVSKIFGHADAAPASETSSSPGGTPGASDAPGAAPTQGSFNNPSSAAPAAPGEIGANASAPAQPASVSANGQPATSVDVEKVLTDMAARNGQKLDWRHSIVDLMKLLDLDSSLSARQELARELHYSGSSDDSAAMNIWLHKQVMQKLAANGGKVPDDLK